MRDLAALSGLRDELEAPHNVLHLHSHRLVARHELAVVPEELYGVVDEDHCRLEEFALVFLMKQIVLKGVFQLLQDRLKDSVVEREVAVRVDVDGLGQVARCRGRRVHLLEGHFLIQRG